MRARARLAALLAALVTGCSLFVDLDGLSNGAGSSTCDGATCVSLDGQAEGAAIEAGGGSDAGTVTYTYNDVTDLGNWERFDLNGYVLDDAADFPGYVGGVSDGRYVYFTPFQIGYTGNFTGLVLRYDTTKGFTDPASWTSFDVTVLDPNAAAFGGQGFDGRFVYFTPGYTTITVRYDTQADFTSSSSWSKIDLGPLGPNTATTTIVSVGKYIYYAPSYNYMFRYDTTLPFDQASSWVGVDQVNLAGSSTYNFGGAAFDGANMILFPKATATPCEALRYDTTQQIAVGSAWSKFDLASLDSGTLPAFERDTVFDGRYAYATPSPQVGSTSIVERYDTQQSFASRGSWSHFDLTASLGIANDDAYGAYDGRYLYVAGYGSSPLVRFDTQGSFDDVASWTSFGLAALPGDATFGFGGTAFDGLYLYFLPHGSGTIYRFHARAAK